MSDDLTARIDEALAGTTPGPWHWGDRTNLLGIGGDVSPGGYVYSVDVLEIEHDGGCGCRRMCQMDVTLSDEDRTLIAAAPSLLAEARDEITRLREGVERHRTAGIADNCGKPGCLTGCGHDSRLWALLDAPSTASPVRDGTNTEQDEP